MLFSNNIAIATDFQLQQFEYGQSFHKGMFTRYDLSGRFCSRSVSDLSFSTIGSLKLLQNNINSTT